MNFSLQHPNLNNVQNTKKRVCFVFVLFLILAACSPRPLPAVPTEITATEILNTPASSPTPTPDIPLTTVPPPSETATVTSTAESSSGSFLLVAKADARVREADPNNNYGDDSTLHADGAGDSEIESFIRFTVNEVPGPIHSARLLLYVTDNGTRDGPAIYATGNNWEESRITWNNRPAPTGSTVDNVEELESNSWLEYDVTSLVTGSGTFNFVLIADSTDGVVFSSREGNQPPQLMITLTAGSASPAVPTPIETDSSEDAVLVGAGDISDCRNNNDELTAQLLDAIPGTVFTTGDNAYNRGEFLEYIACYGPTWGRHRDRTKPIPGNHEYRTSDAAGYFQYFNNIPSYYAYRLGSWRIYALNSEIDVSENSFQLTWLREDLATHPSQCAVAYWHQPRWSSGTHHGSDEDYQVLWQLLYEAGVELVINGHEHHYERFAEMNAEGVASSPGLREFVVGTGGRDLYEFGSPLPASEVREDSTYGVLKLTLRANSYEWEFIPIPGSTFTDSGSTNCH